MWNDKSLTFDKYGLEDRKVIQARKPPLGTITVHQMERKLFFFEHSNGAKSTAYFKDISGRQIEVTRKTFESIGNYFKRITEVLTEPDEIYLTLKGQKYQYAFIKFYQDTSLELVVDFSDNQPFRLRHIKPFRGDLINAKRRGVKTYENVK